MKIRKLALGIMVALAVTACSNGPSEREAKKALRASISDCKFLSIDKFEKINGIAKGEASYQVEVKYSIKMEPSLEITNYATVIYPKNISDFENQANAAKQLNKKYKDDADAWVKENPGKDLNDFNMAHEDRYKELQKDANLLLLSVEFVNEALRRAPTDARANMQTSFFKSCRDVPYFLLKSFFETNLPIEQYGGDIVMAFTGNIPMIKTDNGWELAR